MKFFGVLSVLCGLVLPSAALDREAFSFTKYDLEVRIEPEQRRLGVRGKIVLHNDSASPQKNAVLQISSTLSWLSIREGGKALEFVSQPYVSDVDHTGSLSEAIVALPQVILPQTSVELEIGYEGTISLDATRLTQIGVPEETARHSDWDQIGKPATAVRGTGYVAWYPVATEAASLSEGNSVFETVQRWRIRETNAVAEMKICAEGEVIATGEKKNGAASGCNRYQFSGIGRFAPAFAIAPYSSLVRQGVEIRYFPDRRPAAEDYALAAELAAPLALDWFGPIREKVTLVELADSSALPYETGSYLFAPFPADSRIAQLTAVHQLTHAAIDSSRPWIYEGLAHFAQALNREQQNGRRAALDFMALHRSALADAEKATERTDKASSALSLVNTSMEEFYRSKAMYVWWMLRDMVGDAALKKAIAAYHAGEDKEPSYVQRLVEQQAKRNLEWFFDDWVYRDRCLPDFRVASAYSRSILGGGSMVTITVENLGDAGAEVPVTLRYQGGEVTQRIEVGGKAKGVIRLEATSTPLEVVVNDGSVPESDMSNNSYKIPQSNN